MAVLMEEVKLLKITLEEIKLATEFFSKEAFIAQGGFGKVYIGEISISGQQRTVAIKRLDRALGQGDREFLMEIQMLSCYRHKNIISLLGFCDDAEEKILVYEHAKHGSLDKYVSSSELSWIQRLKISIGAARGFRYLHNGVGPQHRILHRDVKSSNILLDENWEAKISDFGLSKIGPSNVEYTFLVTNACGTFGYIDPQYAKSGILTKESDVYSFGVVLFEILCGRLAYNQQYEDERRFLATLVEKYGKRNNLDALIPPKLKSQMKVDSLELFSIVSYQCLRKKRKERPTMEWIVENLEKALELQVGSNVARVIRVGTWGRESTDGVSENHWSFNLNKDHHLLKIAICHGEAICSFMFTSECRGFLHTSNKVGGLSCEEKVSEVMLDDDEEITGINGTIGTHDGYKIISSLSFETTKRTHGPFGQETDTVFFVPWDSGMLVGFYGIAGDYIESIGVYVASKDIIRVGRWGRRIGFTDNMFSLPLDRNHRLKKITIMHSDQIHLLMLTTQYQGLVKDSVMAGNQNGRLKRSEVTLDWDEEIILISGTVGLTNIHYGWTTSISFVTNRNIHGPFGRVRGTPFIVPCEKGSFAGIYGLAGQYIDSIGVYLRAVL